MTPVVHQLPAVPLMHWQAFARSVGLDDDVVRGLCDKGHLPVLKIGKHRFVNLAVLTRTCLEVEDN